MSARDELYGVDPAEFVAERDRIVKDLRAEGRKEDAAAVKALRRPSVPVWALNQVARRHASDLEALVDATDAVRDTLESGGDVRDALGTRRDALRAVVRRAREVVAASGRAADAQEREIEAALLVVIDVPDALVALKGGKLPAVPDAGPDSDDVASMFQPVTGEPAVPKPPSRRLVQAQETLARREEELASAETALAEAEVAAADARKTLDAATRARDKAEAARDSAQAALDAMQ